jgi:ATP-binding cassette subfamily C protein LapB
MVEPAADAQENQDTDAPSPETAEEGGYDHELETESAATEDPLLACLVFLTRHYGRPRSAEVLKAGLPFTGRRLPPSLFLRAAERAGFVGRVVKRRLASISNLVLPAVLMLKGDQACVVIEYVDKKTALVMLPETGGGVQKVDRASLDKIYSGYAIFLRPEFQFDIQRQEADIPKPRAWFWGTIFRSRWIYGQVVLAALLINTFALATPMFIMGVYDRILPNEAIHSLAVLAGGVVVILVFDFIIRSLRGYFIDVAGKRADVILANRIFDQVLDMRLASRPASAGAFANTLREFETVRDFFTSATLATLVDLPFVFLFILVIWFVGGPVAYVPVVAATLVLAVGLILQIPLKFVVRKNFQESEQKHGVLVETINGLETIKSIGADARMRQMWEGFVGLSSRTSQRARFLSQSGVNFAVMIQQITTIGVVFFGAFRVFDGAMTVGALIACVILTGRTMAPLGQIAQLLTRLNQSVTSLKALDRLMGQPVERPPNKVFLHRPSLLGEIAFSGVNFAYPNQDVEVIKDMSFNIKSGEHVGIIGRVGSGKSTLAKLMLGLYETTAGAILVDGTDTRQIDPVDLRRSIGYVSQDVFLFRGTVRDNIAVAAPHADDAQVLHAARLAGVDDFVKKHPLGYDLPVGERGEGLSGGQRQAIAVARALLLNPNIVILDEPTSSMDTRTEEAFKSQFSDVLAHQTLILITHRASLLSMVDRLIVLDGGRVVADGPRQAVLDALAGGRVAAPKV